MSIKLTAVLLFTTIVQVSATVSYGQRLSLQQKDVTLKQVFKEIKKQTGYDVFYQSGKLRAGQRIDASFLNAPLEDVMKVCLQRQALDFVLYENTIIIKEREKTILDKLKATLRIPFSGRITDSKGQALPGVSIRLKGTSVATVTDAEGNFTLQLPGDTGTLVFSYMGYVTKEVEVDESRTVLSIQLEEDTKALSEVVVVGYGMQRKSSMTAAVSTVKMKDVENAPRPNILSSLEGRVPGLTVTETSGEPGSSPSLLVRGVGTIDGATNPLVVIDGSPNGNLASIAPGDIESISILKDAAAAAIYGARAANGVILVTTKQGGQMDKAVLSFNSYVGLQQPTRTPGTISSFDYATLVNEAAFNEGRPAVYSEDDLRLFKEGTDPDMHANTDWLNEVLQKNAPIVNNYLSVSGNSKIGKYFVSGEYLYQKGSVKKIDHFNRINLRANLTSKISDKLQLQVLTTYLRTKRDAANAMGIFNNALRASATSPVRFSDGHWGGQMFANGNHLWTTGNQVSVIEQYGPVANNWSNYAINANLEYKPVDGLTLKLLGVYQASNTDFSNYSRKLESWDFITRSVSQVIPNSLTENWSKDNKYDLQATATYEKNFGKHYLKALGGYSLESYRNDWITAYRRDFINDGIYELNGGDAATQTNGGGADHWAFMSGFGRLNYSFEDRFLLEFTARYDGSSRFAPGRKWGFFPSVSAGWNLQKESFLRNWEALDMLKLRVSVGQLGNAEKVRLYESYPNLVTGPQYNFNDVQVVGVLLDNPANPNLSWETTTTYNVGLDGSIRNGLLGFEADIWRKNTKDILLNVPVSTIIGLPSSRLTTNAGEVAAHGFDLMLTHNGKAGANFSYNASFTISGWRSWIIDLKDRATPYSTEFRPGEDLGNIYGYEAIGIINSEDQLNAYKTLEGVPPQIGLGDLMYKDQNGDKRIDYMDAVNIGNSYVKTQYGLNLGMQYKAFDLSMFFQGAGNTNRVIGEFVKSVLENYNSPLAVHLDRWNDDNRNANAEFPRILQNFSHNNSQSSWWIRNGAYVRLKNLQLGYNVPSKALSRLNIQSLRAYVAATNLLTIAPGYVEGFDPERDVINTWYPTFRVVSLGINLKL
ncbi:SusC/RagA family TonB-linked outer membrane protein [Chitinophaga cymbidii]|uniref:SusC/RagA family TonB-linked outer membrane protein n=1 Tax=Chitinophaga cymbidii TaxID=1096750 RepID=A0A512RTB2_9BACT|nr:TonB-dependent receptor [Chitinophaga cymbidii]GEP98938.1 SusC/RagA family TonB-linked outer membrane protein [Chitinophaga cymbidii]